METKIIRKQNSITINAVNECGQVEITRIEWYKDVAAAKQIAKAIRTAIKTDMGYAHCTDILRGFIKVW